MPVLDLVSKGEAEIGVVYRTDAVADDHVRIVDTAPAESHSPVRYGVAMVWTARTFQGPVISSSLCCPLQSRLNSSSMDSSGGIRCRASGDRRGKP